MSSMKDVAEKASVSRATVSRVLSGHPSVSPETRSNVLFWVKKLNYQPNIIAQTLAGNKTNVIGVILPEISNPFYAEILGAIENEASYQGYSILLSCTEKNLEKEKSILNTLKSRKVDGIITIPVSITNSGQLYKNTNIPTVCITKKMEGFSCVMISHYDAGKKVAENLLELGFQKIGYVGPTESSTSAIKYQGFSDFLNDRCIKPTDIIEVQPLDSIDSFIIYDSVLSYISKKGLNSDAIFASDDVTACDTIRALSELGYKVPNDIAVIGFDNSLLSKKMHPTVSSLSQPLSEIGRKAINILIEQIISENYKENIYELETRVISRESTLNTKIT